MFNLRRKLVVAVVLSGLLSSGALAQRRGDKRPPKEDNRVVVQPKERGDRGERPPRGNENPRGKKEGKKGKN